MAAAKPGPMPFSRYPATWKRVPKRYVFTLDWGIADPLRLLNGGRLMLATGNEQTSKPEVSPEDRAIVLRMLNDPENLYVAHTKAFELFEGSAAKFVEVCRGGRVCAANCCQTVSDSHGRPVYEDLQVQTQSRKRLFRRQPHARDHHAQSSRISAPPGCIALSR